MKSFLRENYILLILIVFLMGGIIKSIGKIENKSYYISNVLHGTGDALKWESASTPKTFDWKRVQPGDTIFIDGGSDSLIYSSMLVPDVSGGEKNKVIITRGRGKLHRGEPIFRVYDRYCVYINKISNVELSYLTLQNLGKKAYIALCVNNSANIDIMHNIIYHPEQKGSAFIRSSGKYLNNIDSTGSTESSEETDCLDLNYEGNIEVAYNSFFADNRSDIGHNDIIQCSYLYGGRGYNKIHHNFAIQKKMGGVFYFGSCQGSWIVYDNILIGETSGWNSVLEFNNAGDSSKPLYVKVYNNTIVGKGNMYPIMIENCDSLQMINNLIYKADGDLAVNLYGSTAKGCVIIDYNAYCLSSKKDAQARIAGLSYNRRQWKELGYEVNGISGKILLNNLWGMKPEDYSPLPNSIVIDSGTPLKFLGTDYFDITRPQGKNWDIGAKEQ